MPVFTITLAFLEQSFTEPNPPIVYSAMTVPLLIQEANAISVPIVAVAGSWIAWQQSRIARQKLRLDLYGRRFRIFTIVMQAVIDAVNQSNETVFDVETARFNKSVREARFLFSSDIYEYLSSIEKSVLQCRQYIHMTKSAQLPDGSDGVKLNDQFTENLQWLNQQITHLPARLHSDMAVDDSLTFSRKPEVMWRQWGEGQGPRDHIG